MRDLHTDGAFIRARTTGLAKLALCVSGMTK